MTQPTALTPATRMSFITHNRQSKETLGDILPRNSLHEKPASTGPINLFAICCDYEGMYWKPRTLEGRMLIPSKKDLECILKWVVQLNPTPNVHILLNKEVTREGLVTILNQAGTALGCNVVYLSGHATYIGNSFVFLPVDCIEDNEINTRRGLSAYDMRSLLLNEAAPRPSAMILITEFCFADNFLGLPYVLRLEANKPPVWSNYDQQPYATGHGASIWNHDRHILHFSGAAAMKQTYSTKVGGWFTNAFCDIPPNERMSLADRVKQIQKVLDSISQKRGPKYCQQVQLYSSHRLDLFNTDTLENCLTVNFSGGGMHITF